MSKPKIWLLATIFAGIFSSSAFAACHNPGMAPSNFPDGSTATQKQMLAAKAKVDSYMGAAQAYIKCMDAEDDAMQKYIQDHPKMDKDKKAAHVKAIEAGVKERNKVVDQMKATAAAFNAEIHKYNQQ